MAQEYEPMQMGEQSPAPPVHHRHHHHQRPAPAPPIPRPLSQEFQLKKAVFAMDVEKVEALIGGVRKQVAGRVVLVREDRKVGWIKVLDLFIKYPPGVITNYLTKYSKLEPYQLDYGVDRQTALDFLFAVIHNGILVTFGGCHDYVSLGTTRRIVELFAETVELQEYFKRPDGSAYGLGPLVEYFGYRRNGKLVIIRHYCIDDAVYTLRLYLDHYRGDDDDDDAVFSPTRHIRSKREYKIRYNVA